MHCKIKRDSHRVPEIVKVHRNKKKILRKENNKDLQIKQNNKTSNYYNRFKIC